MFLVLSLLVLPVDPDPRIPLVELQDQGRYEEALQATETSLARDPATGALLGLDYLKGHLLEQLQRPDDAIEAYETAMSASPPLAPFVALRLALLTERQGHPEVAAGLTATLLGKGPPEQLIPAATRLLIRSLADGGDCRLLRRLASWRLPDGERRRLELLWSDCLLRQGREEEAGDLLLGLLREDTEDLAAHGAALRLLGQPRLLHPDPELLILLGRAFHAHREFSKATLYLEEGLGGHPSELPFASPDEEFDTRYALARGYFWLGHYRTAATAFGSLAEATEDPERRARVLYQQGRSHELAGAWDRAGASYRQAFEAEPEGRWADAALVARLRILWRTGREAEALELYERLHANPRWRDLARRAAFFLASSDVVRGRPERAAAWLAGVAPRSDDERAELAYWRGRIAELRNDPTAAARAYAEAMRNDRFHPLSQAAAARLRSDALAPAAHAEGLRRVASRRRTDLHTAWLLLGSSPGGRIARRQLERSLARRSADLPFLRIEATPVADWPLWSATLREPGELLLGLGIWELGEPYVLRHFPVSQPALAYTGSLELAAAGRHRPSLRIAEILAQRIPKELPPELVAENLIRLLYPFPYRDLVEEAARFAHVDPYLMVAIIREESRFDPDAVSAAAARGLTQFVLPTARRLGNRLGLEALAPEDLHQPQPAITLGAAYLAELAERFGRLTPAIVAAYNAGEDQASLWRSYCFSLESEEYFSKIGFSQTRAYVQKVLASRAWYERLYAPREAAR